MFRQCHRLIDAVGEACKICKGESQHLHLSVEGPGQHLARRKADAEACGL